ncbi:MAG: holliday junction helicase RuvA [Acidobacteriota bacterium]|jgi:Holliday junction DNA helicase RuvA|nr:holliday junction helicase RuvA [Acidobacteriota bacterium]MDT5261328.1 holliday junction helicase RuvA [Acidobacteriota bacterium]MDT7780971.1 holliday junction helicase RuvA [Acidobacteriota bacterium]
MIGYLSGTLLAKHATSVIIDVGGVGYEVTIPVTTFYDLEEPGSAVRLRIYTHVREEALQLFGFRTERERELFTLLISVSGIGPKSAIAMLSGMSADEIVLAIRTNNYARLTSIPGVGRKTAERLVIELRDKMAALSSPALEQDIASGAAASTMQSEDALRDDTLAALLQLGFPKPAADKAMTSAMSEGGELSVETLLRRSLRQLSKG